MANNKSYIQKAIDKTFNEYKKRINSGTITREEVQELYTKLMDIIKDNEEEYLEQIEIKMSTLDDIIAEREEQSEEVEVNLYSDIPKKAKLSRGVIAASVVATIALSIYSCRKCYCSTKPVTTTVIEEEGLDEKPNDVIETNELEETIEDLTTSSNDAEIAVVNAFVAKATQRTEIAMNLLLSNGVVLTDVEMENASKLIAEMGLQYYLVANIDEITTLEYANFMQEKPGAVLDNDDLIYNFRNINILFKQQMLVCTPDNRIDFASIYNNEYDAELLNGGASILARLNVAESKKERKAISKEFYEYIQNTILNSTDKLKYSNSAVATFINTEFSAWTELTKSSKYGKGYYPDDELEAKIMTVISNCGMSEGEQTDLEIHDETKTSLESINVIRVLNSLNERKENILPLSATGNLVYVEGSAYGDLVEEVKENIYLENYVKIQSFADKKKEELKQQSSNKHPNDSGVEDGKGGIISEDQFEQNNIDPKDENAKQQLEQKVEEETKIKEETVNSKGETIDPVEAASWAQKGAIDANNGTRNNNVPAIYQEAYNNGWNAANEAKKEAEKQSSSSTFEPVNGNSTSQIIEETYEGFKEDSKPNIPNTPIVEVDGDIETTTEFVPVNGNSTSQVVEETYEGFTRSISKSSRIQAYKDLRASLMKTINSIKEAADTYDEIIENSNVK